MEQPTSRRPPKMLRDRPQARNPVLQVLALILLAVLFFQLILLQLLGLLLLTTKLLTMQLTRMGKSAWGLIRATTGRAC